MSTIKYKKKRHLVEPRFEDNALCRSNLEAVLCHEIARNQDENVHPSLPEEPERLNDEGTSGISDPPALVEVGTPRPMHAEMMQNNQEHRQDAQDFKI